MAKKAKTKSKHKISDNEDEADKSSDATVAGTSSSLNKTREKDGGTSSCFMT